MATSVPISPMSEHSQFHNYFFDPQIEYAEVLAEAQRYQEEEKASSISHLKAPLDQFHKSAEDVKKRKSWKSSLFFWRKSSQKKRVNRAIPLLKSRAKPIYMNDIAPSHRSGRPAASPLAAMFSAMERREADVPYMPLVHHSHRRVSLSRPIYLVT